MNDDPDEHRQLRDAIERVANELAHVRGLQAETLMQVKLTNGRVTALEGTVAEAETDLTHIRHTLWGPPDEGLSGQGGLVGWTRASVRDMRSIRRDIRILGGLIVGALPLNALFQHLSG